MGTKSIKRFAFFLGRVVGGSALSHFAKGPSQERNSLEEEIMRLMFILQNMGHFCAALSASGVCL